MTILDLFIILALILAAWGALATIVSIAAFVAGKRGDDKLK